MTRPWVWLALVAAAACGETGAGRSDLDAGGGAAGGTTGAGGSAGGARAGGGAGAGGLGGSAGGGAGAGGVGTAGSGAGGAGGSPAAGGAGGSPGAGGAGGIGGGGGGGNDGGTCATPLDADTLARLTLSLQSHIETLPDRTVPLRLGTMECCVVFVPVTACVWWSVTSSDPGITVDPVTGVLSVGPATPSGARATVTADVENGRRSLTIDVYVYTPAAAPLVDTWHEVKQLECGTGAEVDPRQPILELRFHANGDVAVTWTPFEVYVDYWGTYGAAAGALTIAVTGGNYVPPDVDPSGSYEIDATGRLVLRDLWLGSPRNDTAPARCGHVFLR